MVERNILQSPSWFLSAGSDANEAGIYVYLAKQLVCVCDITEPRLGPRLLRTYTGHTERLSGVALSPSIQDTNESPVTESSQSGCDAGTGNLVTKKAKDVGSGVLCCSGGDDKSVRIWTVDSLRDVQSHCEHKEKISTLCWSPVNASLLASGDVKGKVIVWDRKSNRLIKWRHEKDCILSMAFCPHQPALLALGFHIGTVFLVDFSSGRGHVVHRLRGHEEDVMSISWCPVPGESFLVLPQEGVTSDPADADQDTNNCLIATGSKDRTIRVWTLSRGKQAFLKRLPTPRKDHTDTGFRNKTWLSIHWLKSNPEHLVSSSTGGDLLLWTLRPAAKGQHTFQTFAASEFKPHIRSIFNICASGPDGKTLCTFAQDRQLILWNVDSLEAVSSMSTCGGFVYCLRTSPIDPGRVAMGVGDSMIRVWNTSNKSNPYDMTTIWHGIKSKVTTVAWHPLKESLLGYATEDGRVGTCDVLSNKMPVMSNTFHHHTVYVVCWGPSSQQHEDPKSYSLYSVGDLKILEHTRAAFFKGNNAAEASNFFERIVAANSEQLKAIGLKTTELSWNLELHTAAIGTDDGSVFVVSAAGLRLLATVKVHQRMVNCTRWHPTATAGSPSASPCRHWLAIAGNDHVINVVDLSSVLEREGGAGESLVMMSSLRELVGHSQRVTDMCWSPHCDARLISVGFDAEAFVWDVQKGTSLAMFRGHPVRILTCQFSSLDPDLVMSGGTDNMVLEWRVSKQPAPELGQRKKRKRKMLHAAMSTATSTLQMAEEDVSEAESISSELQGLQDTLEEKRQALLKGSQGQDGHEGKIRPCSEVSYHDIPSDEGEMLTGPLAAALQDHERAATKNQSNHGADRCPDLQPPSYVSKVTSLASSKSSQSSVSPASQAASVQPPVARTVSSGQTSEDGESDREDSGGEGEGVEKGASSSAASGALGSGGGGSGVLINAGGFKVAKGCSSQVVEKKKRRTKTYFPRSAQAENKGRNATYEDLLHLTRYYFDDKDEEKESIGGTETSDAKKSGSGGGNGGGDDDDSSSVGSRLLAEDKHHLGLFTDRRGAYQYLKQEVAHHLRHDNMEYALQMELWKGNITGVIQLARERSQLSDWIVALAPLASYETWETVCEEYARQLEEEGQYHKAVSYLLVCHKLYPAIDLFRRHKLFREAVALAHVRLSLQDPVWEDLYTDWSAQLMRNGAYEQAAKCYLAMKRIQDAAQAITRRNDQSASKAACHMTLVANEKQQGQLYAQQVVTRFLLGRQWAQCHDFLRGHQPLKVFLPYISVHEMLMRELSVLVPELTAAGVDTHTPPAWDTLATDKMELPEFMLDPREADPVLPWEPYLVCGRTFPHHVLRAWHLCLAVAMDTEQLHLVYHALQQLQSARQTHLDTQQVLLQVCSDVTLWLLALLTNQTTLAISHLLGALSTLHEGGHSALMTALCRLLLPQGPKYTLKLQQEVTALRVLITMESQGDVEGGGKHLSLRRYLSELKEEPSVSTGAMRCKQLDCVRAYYYLTVLNHLQHIYSDTTQEAVTSPSSTAGVGMTGIGPNPSLGVAASEGVTSSGGVMSSVVPGRGVTSSGGMPSSGVPGGSVTSVVPVTSTVVPVTAPVVPGRGVTSSGGMTLSEVPSSVPSGGPSSSSEGPDSGSAQRMDGNRQWGEKEEGEIQLHSSSTTSMGDSEGDGEATAQKDGQSVGKEGNGMNIMDVPPSIAKQCRDDSDMASVASKVPSSSSSSLLPSSSGRARGKAGGADSCVDAGSAGDGMEGSSKEEQLQGQTSPERGQVESGSRAGGGLERGSWQLSLSRLLQLSKGLLWDIQAKRLALTDTLGYIHQAISQHLLTDRSREVARTLSRHPNASANNQHPHHHHHHHHPHVHHTHHAPPQELDSTTSFAPVLADTVASHLPSNPLLDIEDVGVPSPSTAEDTDAGGGEGGVSKGVEGAGSPSVSGSGGGAVSSSKPSRSPPLSSGALPSHASSSGKRIGVGVSPPPPPPPLPSSSDPSTLSPPLPDSNFDLDLVTLGQQSDGSRRVLWQDDPVSGSGGRGGESRWGFGVGGDSSAHKPTSLLSPGKYINVPDEWYSLSVDEKYGRSYVTLAILKDEQEFVMGELKRISDSSQVPFPNPFQSVETLLSVCVSSDSDQLPAEDKHNYVQSLQSWAMHFAVTAQQRTHTQALFQSAEKDIGL